MNESDFMLLLCCIHNRSSFTFGVEWSIAMAGHLPLSRCCDSVFPFMFMQAYGQNAAAYGQQAATGYPQVATGYPQQQQAWAYQNYTQGTQ